MNRQAGAAGIRQNAMILYEKTRMRQFWLRVLLVLGILWGGMPLLTLPLVVMGVIPAPFGLFVTIVNGVIVAPACTLAFWHRRSACIWLNLNAVMAGVAIALLKPQTSEVYLDGTIGLVGSVVIALCLDFMEIRRWPQALNR